MTPLGRSPLLISSSVRPTGPSSAPTSKGRPRLMGAIWTSFRARAPASSTPPAMTSRTVSRLASAPSSSDTVTAVCAAELANRPASGVRKARLALALTWPLISLTSTPTKFPMAAEAVASTVPETLAVRDAALKYGVTKEASPSAVSMLTVPGTGAISVRRRSCAEVDVKSTKAGSEATAAAATTPSMLAATSAAAPDSRPGWPARIVKTATLS